MFRNNKGEQITLTNGLLYKAIKELNSIFGSNMYVIGGSVSLLMQNKLDRPCNDIDVITMQSYYGVHDGLMSEYRQSTNAHSGRFYDMHGNIIQSFCILLKCGVIADIFYYETTGIDYTRILSATIAQTVKHVAISENADSFKPALVDCKIQSYNTVIEYKRQILMMNQMFDDEVVMKHLTDARQMKCFGRTDNLTNL